MGSHIGINLTTVHLLDEVAKSVFCGHRGGLIEYSNEDLDFLRDGIF
jgi:hypothetical protein